MGEYFIACQIEKPNKWERHWEQNHDNGNFKEKKKLPTRGDRIMCWDSDQPAPW